MPRADCLRHHRQSSITPALQLTPGQGKITSAMLNAKPDPEVFQVDLSWLATRYLCHD
jgi:hypothetical protein